MTISQTNVQIDDWNGIGYIVKDPATGAGAYMISGGLAGGDSTKKADGTQVVALFKGPYGWVKDDLDPNTRNTIVTAAELNVGELVSVADAMAGMSYSDVNQCVGLVRIAYWAAGICLDMWSPWSPPNGIGSCGQNNLVQKYHISGTNGVSYFYNLANYLKINNSVRTTNDPLVGDLIFWDNTWDMSGDCTANDLRTHVGIVKQVPDEFGTLLFIHASGSGVSTDRLMNISSDYNSSSNFNTFLRNNWTPCVKCDSGESCPGTSSGSITCRSGTKLNQCTQEQWDSVGKLAGQLFSGFGTIRDVSTDSSHQ